MGNSHSHRERADLGSPSPLRWTFSNRLELLAEQLAAQWRAQPGVFLRRRVVVPDSTTGFWLQGELARRLGICSGMKWITLFQLAGELHQQLIPDAPRSLPNQGELAATLIGALVEGLRSPSRQTPLARALQNSPLARLGEDEQQLFEVGQLLARAFLRYSASDPDGIERALAHRSGADERWQFELWRATFGPSGPWLTWAELCEALCERFPRHRRRVDAVDTADRLDLFAPRFISSGQWRLLRLVAKQIPVQLFVLSPCRHYWSDLRTPREAKRLLRWMATRGASANTLEAFEATLRNCQPLLASLGKAGRRLLGWSEVADDLTDECFALPAKITDRPEYRECWQQGLTEVSGEDTLLGRLQADLLLLRDEQALSSKPRSSCDGSIQVHCAPTRLGEIELVAALIHQSLAGDSTLALSDILLLSPKLDIYGELLSATLARGEPPLDCQVLQGGAPPYGSFWQSFDQLLQACERGWNSIDLQSALENPLIRKSAILSEEDVIGLKELFRAGEIAGELGSERCEGADENYERTWRAFHRLVLRGLVTHRERAAQWREWLDPASIPCCQTDNLSASASALSRWLSWFEALVTAFDPVARNDKLTLEEWGRCFEAASERLFALVPAEDRDRRALRIWCRDWAACAEETSKFSAQMRRAPISATSALSLLRGAMSRRGSGRPLRKGALRLTAFDAGPTPARIIILMGADSRALPSYTPAQPFELSPADGAEFWPNSSDRDRGLFLEMILAARQKLLITYTEPDLDADGGEIIAQPSTLVCELLKALQAALPERDATEVRSIFAPKSKGSGLHFAHPLDAADMRYFAPASAFRHFGQRPFRRALAKTKKAQTHLPLCGIESPQAQNSQRPIKEVYQLEQLGRALEDPLEHYLKTRCGLWLGEKTIGPRRWFLRKAKQRKLLLLDRLRGLVPPLNAPRRHWLARANAAKIVQLAEKTEGRLGEFAAEGGGFELFFSHSVATARRLDATSWLLPAIATSGDQPALIEGHLPADVWFGPWGIALPYLELKEQCFGEFCRCFPAIAALSAAHRQIGIDATVHLAGFKWELNEQSFEEFWLALLRFAEAAQSHPMPLLPSGFEQFEREDASALKALWTQQLKAKEHFKTSSAMEFAFGASSQETLIDRWLADYRGHWQAVVAPVLTPIASHWQSLLSSKPRRKRQG